MRAGQKHPFPKVELWTEELQEFPPDPLWLRTETCMEKGQELMLLKKEMGPRELKPASLSFLAEVEVAK